MPPGSPAPAGHERGAPGGPASGWVVDGVPAGLAEGDGRLVESSDDVSSAPVTARIRRRLRRTPAETVRDNAHMRISARADYAIRAALQLAASQDGGPLKAEAIADAQDIPHKFLESILNDMRRGGLVLSRRGGNGGYRLAKPAESISIADVIRVVDGPLVSVRGVRPPELSYTGPAESLLPLWIALRSNVREILEGVSLADVASARLPARVSALTSTPDAWTNP
ncbi:hypothetical protein GCM10009549_26080 [Streptomyces thermoalcalitolerans]|uniref:Rrf2 family transcriptional regulator n=2 Tax=Streptomyces thermoalcalitolerans TaxID=65605 RepID=A0ABN1NP83_9ACTN